MLAKRLIARETQTNKCFSKVAKVSITSVFAAGIFPYIRVTSHVSRIHHSSERTPVSPKCLDDIPRRCLVTAFFGLRVIQTQVLVDAILRVDEEGESPAAFLDKFQREGNLALNCQAGLTRDYSGKILKPNERGRDRRPPILNNFTGELEDSDTESSDEADVARVRRSQGRVLLAKKAGLPAMRKLVETTADWMSPIDPTERMEAAEHARRVVLERAAARAAARAEEEGRTRKPEKTKKARQAGHESEEEEEEEDIAGVPNEFLSAVFDHWATMRERGPVLRCYHTFRMRRWTRMADPVREVRTLRSCILSSEYLPLESLLVNHFGMAFAGVN